MVFCSLSVSLRRVLDLDFQEDPSNRRRDSAVNVLCTPTKVSFITGRSLISDRFYRQYSYSVGSEFSGKCLERNPRYCGVVIMFSM